MNPQAERQTQFPYYAFILHNSCKKRRETCKIWFLFGYPCFAYQGLKLPNFKFTFWSPYGIESMYTNHAVGNRVICGFGVLVFCKWQEHFYMFLHFTITEYCTDPDNNLKGFSRHKAHRRKISIQRYIYSHIPCATAAQVHRNAC